MLEKGNDELRTSKHRNESTRRHRRISHEEQELHLAKYHTHTDECTVTERKQLCEEITEDGQICVPGRWHRKGEHTAGCFYDSVSHTCGLGELYAYTHDIPTKEQLIGLFLDIDPKRLSTEKDAMYEELRAGAR